MGGMRTRVKSEVPPPRSTIDQARLGQIGRKVVGGRDRLGTKADLGKARELRGLPEPRLGQGVLIVIVGEARRATQHGARDVDIVVLAGALAHGAQQSWRSAPRWSSSSRRCAWQ